MIILGKYEKSKKSLTLANIFLKATNISLKKVNHSFFVVKIKWQ